jgi:hypothetical protein
MVAGRSSGRSNNACVCGNDCSRGRLTNSSASAYNKQNGKHPNRHPHLLLLPRSHRPRKPDAWQPSIAGGGTPFLFACSSRQTAQKNETHPVLPYRIPAKSRDDSRLPGIIAREQQVVRRSRIVPSFCSRIFQCTDRELDVGVDTVRMFRDRWARLQGIDLERFRLAERLQVAPRPGATPKFTAEQLWHMVYLKC